MNFSHRAKLEQLGLAATEAQVYLALLQHGALPAARLASETGIARTSIYPTLCSLADKGLVEGGLGHGSRFAAVSPDEGLRSLIARETQRLSDRERIAKELAEALTPLAADAESAVDDPVQVIRTPHAISQRFERLQLEAERTADVIVKAPILNPRKENPAQQKAQRRGVHYRGLYERAAIEDPTIKPYVQGWTASGEEARVYNGELPYKLLIFDAEIVLMILTRRAGQSSALLVRHEPLAKSLTQWFNSLWDEAEPLVFDGKRPGAARGGRLAMSPRRSAAGTSDGNSRNTAGTRRPVA